MTSAQIISWVVSAITFGTVIMYGSIGETINQKCGNLNLGVPGIMQLGGIGGLAGAFIYESSVSNPNGVVGMIIALLSALLASGLGALIYSFLTVSLKANQNVTGLTLTILGTGVANFFGGSMIKLSGGVGSISVAATSNVFKLKLPFINGKLGLFGSLFLNYGWMAYLALVIAFLANYFLTKTRVGLNLRAIGENPGTADAAGINVTKYKYLASIIGGMICGLGGLFYVMDYIQGTWANDNTIEALGWLSVALVIFTSWKPKNSTWGAYVFGLCYWAYVYIPTGISQFLAKVFNVERVTYLQNLYKMLPYIVTIIVLCVVSAKKKKENQAPEHLGLSYFREER